MRKKERLLVVAGLLLSALTGCSKGDDSSVASSLASNISSQVSSVSSVSSEKVAARTHKTYDFYEVALANKASIELSFFDDYGDVPFIDEDTISGTLKLFTGLMEFDTTVSNSTHTITVKNKKTSAYCLLDFENRTAVYSDYDAFNESDSSTSPFDVLASTYKDSNNKDIYIQRQSKSVMRQGESVGLNLDNWNIPLYYQEGHFYMPVQTFNDLFLMHTNFALSFNQQAIFLSSHALGDLKDLFYANKPAARSQKMAQFTYDEMTLAMDMQYGLAWKHNINGFDEFISQVGLKTDLLSTDAIVFSNALARLLYTYLSDGHSSFVAGSCYAGPDISYSSSKTPEFFSPDYINLDSYLTEFSEARKAAMAKDAEVGTVYEEIQDTAYVTFDEFVANSVDLYTNPVTSEPLSLTDNTFAIIEWAQKQITRENSPIKNVVLDLTCNGGGIFDAAAYVLGWAVGYNSINGFSDAALTFKSVLTGGTGTTILKSDTNMDYVFDEKDTLAGKNVFCLTSSFSFSCGNLVPSVFKNSGRVKLIGEKTGGGACVVQPMVLADGTFMNLSGNTMICTVKNGVYTDVDDGVTPDYTIKDASLIFDRAALRDYITSL